MKNLFTNYTLSCCFSIATHAQSKTGKVGLQVETGYAFTLSDGYPEYDHQAFNIAVSPGYHVTDKLFAGVGVALYNYTYSKSNIGGYGADKPLNVNSDFISIPLYAHGMWKFGRAGNSGLFVSLKAGYGIISKTMNPITGQGATDDVMYDYSGGLYLSPSLGYIYPINDKHAISLSVSYDHQDYSTTFKTDERDYKNKKNNSTVGVKIGWAF